MGPCLFVLVTALNRQGQRGGMPGAGLADLARGEERFAQAVERLSLPGAIAGLAVQGQRLPEMADGLPAAALPQLGEAQASQCPGLAPGTGSQTFPAWLPMPTLTPLPVLWVLLWAGCVVPATVSGDGGGSRITQEGRDDGCYPVRESFPGRRGRWPGIDGQWEA